MSPEEQLVEDLSSFAYDPLGFVQWAFPWGEGELTKFKGPQLWQQDVLRDIGKGVLTPNQAVRLCVASGHGIGKSALVAWITLWAFSTFPGTRGVVTANTETQLRTKTWVELAKWHRLSLTKDILKLTATALFTVDETKAREWRVDVVPWSERNAEAFAGLHNQGKRVLLLFDEASVIPDIIWETAQGALTDKDTEIMWCCFGNPTSNQGRFRQCFDDGQFAHRWKQRKIDSRTVSITNKEELAEWAEDFGEDSDTFRVRALGEFPRSDSEAFISYQMARDAAERKVEPQTCPVVIGVDVARYGKDMSVLYPRQGRDASSRPPEVYSKISTMELVNRIMAMVRRYSASVVMVDGGGVGGGVVDRLRQLMVSVVDVQFGGKAEGLDTYNPAARYGNKRTEIWGAMRGFLKDGSIVSAVRGVTRSLPQELAESEYTLNARDELMLESKDMMRRRGVASPDVADALACTFASPWLDYETDSNAVNQRAAVVDAEYNPFDKEHLYGYKKAA